MTNLQKDFSDIYDKYVRRIYRFVFLKINSQEIAEDLTSEVFLRGWKAFQKSREGGEEIKNLPAFLYQIARNVIVDFCRQNGNLKVVSAEHNEIIDSSPSLEEKAAVDSEMEEIRLVLSDIKDNYREVVTLRYIDDLSTAEIAEVLGKSEGSVRVTLHRALAAMRKKLA
ncbi:MAG: RNA polymerase sigma factor [bacterium]